MESYEKTKKILIICFSLIIIIILILFIFLSKDDKISRLKGNSESIQLINDYLDTLEKSLNDKKINYTSQISKNSKIDSLIVKIEQPSENDEYIIPYFVSYNIDHKTNQVLTKEEVANYYGYQISDIINTINERLKTYYEEEITLGYVDPNECSFEGYKSFYRNIDDVEAIYELYVKNNKLYIYMSFDINSTSEDIDYFNNLEYDPFKIEL